MESVRIFTDRFRNGQTCSKGYGFVTFKKADDAEKAMKIFVHSIDGRDTYVYWASNRQPGGDWIKESKITAEEEVLSYLS